MTPERDKIWAIRKNKTMWVSLRKIKKILMTVKTNQILVHPKDSRSRRNPTMNFSNQLLKYCLAAPLTLRSTFILSINFYKILQNMKLQPKNWAPRWKIMKNLKLPQNLLRRFFQSTRAKKVLLCRKATQNASLHDWKIIIESQPQFFQLPSRMISKQKILLRSLQKVSLHRIKKAMEIVQLVRLLFQRQEQAKLIQ